jgi:hypothetical protein
MDVLHLDPPFAITKHRLGDQCKSKFSNNSKPWFFRHDKTCIEVRSSSTNNVIASIAISDFTSENVDLFD